MTTGSSSSSLGRVAASGFTPEQIAAREFAFERELWQKHGVVVVRLRLGDTGLPRLITMALEAWAKGRFGGNRRAAA